MPKPYSPIHSGTQSPLTGAYARSATSPVGPIAADLTSAGSSIVARLLRSVECLKALLQSPTAQAGLNESRYNVLDRLRQHGSAPCSQTKLARHLLQSESNLSTLLERMKTDGLISRVRSERDRRVTLVALSQSGREALVRADEARARAVAKVFQILDEQREAALSETLCGLQRKLEQTLGIVSRAGASDDSTGRARRFDRPGRSAIEIHAEEVARSRTTLQNSDEPTT
jgi:DNA-binding MarR family transcriptional regulator